MKLSEDYEHSSDDDDDDDENDEPDEIQRPFYIPSRKRHHNRITKPDISRHSIRNHTLNAKPLERPSFSLVYENVGYEKERINSVPLDNQPKSDPHQQYLFEYGESINGYKILATFKDIQQHPQGDSYLEKYWSPNNSKLLPVSPDSKLDKDNIYSFYQTSCNLLKQDMKTIIKRERIRWHPDRMHLPEATQVFQIINDLWESIQQSQ